MAAPLNTGEETAEAWGWSRWVGWGSGRQKGSAYTGTGTCKGGRRRGCRCAGRCRLPGLRRSRETPSPGPHGGCEIWAPVTHGLGSQPPSLSREGGQIALLSWAANGAQHRADRLRRALVGGVSYRGARPADQRPRVSAQHVSALQTAECPARFLSFFLLTASCHEVSGPISIPRPDWVSLIPAQKCIEAPAVPRPLISPSPGPHARPRRPVLCWGSTSTSRVRHRGAGLAPPCLSRILSVGARQPSEPGLPL